MSVLFGMFITFPYFLGDGVEILKKLDWKEPQMSQKYQSTNLCKLRTNTKTLLYK